MESIAYTWLYLVRALPHTVATANQSRRSRSRLWGWAVLASLGALMLSGEAIAQQFGDRGEEVTRVQMRLQVLGYGWVQPTGLYDTTTQQAIQDFQQRQGLEADGIVGAETRSRLFNQTVPDFVPIANTTAIPAFPAEGITPQSPSSFPNSSVETSQLPGYYDSRYYNSNSAIYPGLILRFGSEGEAVRQLQRALNRRNYNTGGIDGIYGLATENAVRQFQARNGLRVDGEAGRETLAALGLLASNGNQVDPDRYVVVVPGDRALYNAMLNQSLGTLGFVPENRRGSYINAGSFSSREAAESRSYQLRSRGFDARVVFF